MGVRGFLVTYRPRHTPKYGKENAFVRAETEAEARAKWMKERGEKIVSVKPFYAMFAKD